MEPRLKSSTQWSPFPEELCELAVSALTERFAEEYDLDKAQFVVEGRIYREEILGRFGLEVKDQLKQHNFEISLEYDSESEKEKAIELIQTAMDVIEHLWTELLEDDLEDGELSKKWQIIKFEKKTWHYRYSTVNTRLEKEADKLLEEYEKKLVYQDLENNSPLKEDLDSTTLH